MKRKEGNDFPARFQSEVFGMAETARSENKSNFFNPRFLVYNLRAAKRTGLNFLISALYDRLKEENKNNMAVIKKSTFQADKISTKNKQLADENEKYAHYLNCVITAMNNSMSIKVTFSILKPIGGPWIPELHIKFIF